MDSKNCPIYFSTHSQRVGGFTLIELMIVVGVLGILLSIAAPLFARYQAKARQSEAKLALGAIYSAEKSFYSEYSAYIGSFDAIGYAPEGSRRFYNIYGCSGTVVMGYAGSSGTQSVSSINNPFTCTGGTSSCANGAATDQQTFIGLANGCIRNTQTTNDDWTINELKVLKNDVIGI